MGKSTISTGPFSIAMLVHQRVPSVVWSFIISFPFWVAICCHEFGASKSADTPHFRNAHNLTIDGKSGELGTRPEMACLQFGNEYDISFHTVGGRNPTLPWMFLIPYRKREKTPSNWCRISYIHRIIQGCMICQAVSYSSRRRRPCWNPQQGEPSCGRDHFSIQCHHPQVITMWYPSSLAKLVQITPILLWFIGDKSIVNGDYILHYWQLGFNCNQENTSNAPFLQGVALIVNRLVILWLSDKIPVSAWIFRGTWYPLVNVYITMERSTMFFNGKTHYFYGHFQ